MLFDDELFLELIEEFKFNRCDDTFSQGDYNFEIFQHSMEKIFEEERKEQEAKEQMEKENGQNISYAYGKNSNYFFWFSLLFIIFSLSCLGYQYFNFKSIGPSKFK